MNIYFLEFLELSPSIRFLLYLYIFIPVFFYGLNQYVPHLFHIY